MRTLQGRELSEQFSPEEGTRWELLKSSLSLAHPGLASTQLDAQVNILNVSLFGAGVRGMQADRTHGPEELRSGLHSKQQQQKNTLSGKFGLEDGKVFPSLSQLQQRFPVNHEGVFLQKAPIQPCYSRVHLADRP